MKCFGAVIAAKGDDALWEMLEVDKDGPCPSQSEVYILHLLQHFIKHITLSACKSLPNCDCFPTLFGARTMQSSRSVRVAKELLEYMTSREVEAIITMRPPIVQRIHGCSHLLPLCQLRHKLLKPLHSIAIIILPMFVGT